MDTKFWLRNCLLLESTYGHASNIITKTHVKFRIDCITFNKNSHSPVSHDKTPYSTSVWFLTWWRHQGKHFQRYWPFVRGIHRSPVNSPHKGQWREALMFSLICAWINAWVKPHLHRTSTFVPPLSDRKMVSRLSDRPNPESSVSV